MLTFAEIPLHIDQGYGIDSTTLHTLFDMEEDFEATAFALETNAATTGASNAKLGTIMRAGKQTGKPRRRSLMS